MSQPSFERFVSKLAALLRLDTNFPFKMKMKIASLGAVCKKFVSMFQSKVLEELGF